MTRDVYVNIKTFNSSEDFEILVGQDDRSNDYLTFKIASQKDIWFHVSGFPGSHVVLSSGDTVPGAASIKEAAGLAAYFSKMRNAGKVSVSYCMIKNVSKARHADPGTVNIRCSKTIKVIPKLI